MRGLWVRLLASHVLVAVLAGVTAFVLVPWLTPVLFSDEPPGVPAGTNRPAMRQAVHHSLLIGTLLGTAAGIAFGGFATYRLGRSFAAVHRATRQIAGGRYHVRIKPLGRPNSPPSPPT